MNRNQVRIVFFVPEWPASNSAVLDSRVLSMARFMSEDGCKCIFIGCDTEVGKAILASSRIEQQYGIPVKLFTSKWLQSGYTGLYLSVAMAYRKSRRLIREFRPTHIYTQSAPASKFARKLAKQNGALSVFDIQGAVAEECRLKKSKSGMEYRYLLHLETREYLKADKIGSVSNNLAKYFHARTGRGDAVVIPSCYDEKKYFFDATARAEIRRSFGVTDDQWIICYSGGLSVWQRIEDIIELFANLAKMDQRFHFLFLTREGEKLGSMLQNQPYLARRYVFLGCEQNEVYRYLSASDAGIIMRHDIIINNVASPIKIGEYLGCGLPVIYTKGIGDFGELISTEGVGLMLDEQGDISSQVAKFLSGINREGVRRFAEDFARRQFSIASYREKYGNLFSLPS